MNWLGALDLRKKPDVLGLDLSYTGTGYAMLYDGKLHDSGTFGTDSTFGSIMERNKYMHDKLCLLLHDHMPDLVGFEAITVWKNPAATQKLIYVESALYQALLKESPQTPLIRFITSQIKKIAGGDTKLNKSKVLKEVLANYGVNLEDDNQADAYCIAAALHALPSFVDHYHSAKADYKGSAAHFLRDFENGKLYHDSVCGRWVYDVLTGVVSAPSGDVLKTNNYELYRHVRQGVRDLAPVDEEE